MTFLYFVVTNTIINNGSCSLFSCTHDAVGDRAAGVNPRWVLVAALDVEPSCFVPEVLRMVEYKRGHLLELAS
jgi:hypothetical protein